MKARQLLPVKLVSPPVLNMLKILSRFEGFCLSMGALRDSPVFLRNENNHK